MPVKCQRIQGLPCNILGTGDLNEKFLPVFTIFTDANGRKREKWQIFFVFFSFYFKHRCIHTDPPQSFCIIVLIIINYYNINGVNVFNLKTKKKLLNGSNSGLTMNAKNRYLIN